MKNIDKSKLVFINQKDIHIDSPLKTKEIGYYKDAWNRFKKNKASFVAFIIISILLFFVIFGPYMKKYDLAEKNRLDSGKLANLPPKIPVLEKLGIFDGERKISRDKKFLLEMYNSEFGKGIIKSGLPQKFIDNPAHPDYAEVINFTVKVDMYRYQNYIYSQTNEKGEPITIILKESEFQEALRRNTIIEIVYIENTTDLNGKEITNYLVRVDQFKNALNQSADDTYFWFGTDTVGRDLFTLIWRGSRISILMAILVVMINAIIGITIGAIAGYYGGTFDLLFDRFVEILGSIPFLAVLTILVARFDTKLWVIILTFTVTGWIGSYGSARIQFYRFKNREYVLAAKTLGAKDSRVMFKHIFPNAMGIMITSLVLAIPTFIIAEATYSFLGIFNYANVISVGMLLDQGQQQMQQYPHLLIFPAFYISIMMIAFNLFGNGLRDAFNPSLRGVE